VLGSIDEQLANKRRRVDDSQSLLCVVAQQRLVEAHRQAKLRRSQFCRQQKEVQMQQERDKKLLAERKARYEAAQRALAAVQAAAPAAEAATSAAVNVQAAEYSERRRDHCKQSKRQHRPTFSR
jgi:hypothetical protein